MSAFHNLDAATQAAMYDEHYSQQEAFYLKRAELLKRFTDGPGRYYKEYLFKQVIEWLMRGADPLYVIEKLIDINKEQSDRIKEYLNLHAYPQKIEITKPGKTHD